MKHLASSTILLLILLLRPFPIYSFHENLPTHTPAPLSVTPVTEITPTPSTDSTFGLPETADLDQRTITLYLIALVVVIGLVLYLTRPK